MEGLERSLTLCIAPPGAGKTTLFLQWRRAARDRGIDVAWISLDRYTNDPARFWAAMVAAIERVKPGLLSPAVGAFGSGAELNR